MSSNSQQALFTDDEDDNSPAYFDAQMGSLSPFASGGQSSLFVRSPTRGQETNTASNARQSQMQTQTQSSRDPLVNSQVDEGADAGTTEDEVYTARSAGILH